MLVTTPHAQASLIHDLQNEEDFAVPSKLRIDHLEKRDSQYRQINGRNFLLVLLKVTNTEKTLLSSATSVESLASRTNFTSNIDVEDIELSSVSKAVAITIAGNMA